MTVSLFPDTLDLEVEFEDPRGSSTPITITPQTEEFTIEEDPEGSLDVEGSDTGRFPPPALPALGNWVIEVRDLNGGFYATLTDKATCTELRWELNAAGGGRVSGPILDPNLGALFDAQGNLIDGREIHVRRDDLPGPMNHLIPSPRANPRTLEMECFGAVYHLAKKYVGRNNATPELITNGTFTPDVNPWVGIGVSSMTREPLAGDLGPGAIVLTASTAGDFYAREIVDIPSQPFATFIWLRGWVWIDAAILQKDLATSGRALWTVWKAPPSTDVIWQQGVSPNWRNFGVWQQIWTKIFVPADQHSTMEVRLYSPKGLVKYASISAHREERLNCEGTPSEIIGCLVDHAQDLGLNKSRVNIRNDESRGEGTIQIARRYKYAEAANILSSMQEMSSIQGGVDWLCETPSVNDRIVYTMERTGYDPGPSEKCSLVWGENLNDWSHGWNPDKRADRGRVQGRGSGDEVTEAFYDDPDSDLGWEFVRRTTIAGTAHPEAQAEGLGRTYKRPLTFTATVRRTATFDVAYHLHPSNGGLLPGRLVDVFVDHGIVHVNEEFKVLSAVFVPEKETAELQLVPVSTLIDE